MAATSKRDEIVSDIVAGIISGKYLPRTKLPGPPALSKQYGVDLNMIRRVMKVLRDKGYTFPVQGRGTYISGVEDRGCGGG